MKNKRKYKFAFAIDEGEPVYFNISLPKGKNAEMTFSENSVLMTFQKSK